jgi:hypothetical protein
MVRLLAFLLALLVPQVAAAQQAPPAPVPMPVPVPMPAPLTPQVWNPAAGYVTAGQDEPGYRSWYLALPSRATQVAAFNQYLATWQVGGIVPTWQLLRTASQWQRCGAQPFEVPPTSEWPNVVQTLRYIRDYVVPAVGPVEPVSAYRNPLLNACAGGVPGSAHQHFQAVDLVPLRPTTREHLMETMCAAHLRRGSPYQVGLGFYAFLRFHVDSMRFRKWGMAEAPEVSPCRTPVVSPPAKGIDMPPEEMKPADQVAPQAAPAPAPPTVDQPAQPPSH